MQMSMGLAMHLSATLGQMKCLQHVGRVLILALTVVPLCNDEVLSAETDVVPIGPATLVGVWEGVAPNLDRIFRIVVAEDSTVTLAMVKRYRAEVSLFLGRAPTWDKDRFRVELHEYVVSDLPRKRDGYRSTVILSGAGAIGHGLGDMDTEILLEDRDYGPLGAWRIPTYRTEVGFLRELTVAAEAATVALPAKSQGPLNAPNAEAMDSHVVEEDSLVDPEWVNYQMRKYLRGQGVPAR